MVGGGPSDRQDSARWIGGGAHFQCRVGSTDSDTAVPEGKAFQEESVKIKCLPTRKLQISASGLNEALLH